MSTYHDHDICRHTFFNAVNTSCVDHEAKIE